MIKTLPLRLADGTAERVRRSHADAINEIQGLPFAGARIVESVPLADGVATPVNHGLGREPIWVGPSIPRGAVAAGYIVETRPSAVDRSKSVVLTANDFGATIIVDVVFL